MVHGTFLSCEMASPGHQPVSRQATETARETLYMAHQVHGKFYNEIWVLHPNQLGFIVFFFSAFSYLEIGFSNIGIQGDGSASITEKMPRPQVYREMNRVWCPSW